jgi:predicted transcriptional regulator
MGDGFMKLNPNETMKVLMDDKYTITEMKILLYLGLHLKSDEMFVDINIDKLMVLTKVKKTTLYRSVKNLIKYGDIERSPLKGYKHRYFIKAPFICEGRLAELKARKKHKFVLVTKESAL